MGTEIERKFLVRNDGWKGLGRPVMVRQGYLCTDRGKVVRVRTTGGKGFLSVKGAGTGITRPEYEYRIPLEDAQEMIDAFCGGLVVEKRRHLVEHQGLTWEIDEFLGANQGLVLAELELESEDQVFGKPHWVGKEVSQDPRYLNANLARRPYREWGSEARGAGNED